MQSPFLVALADPEIELDQAEVGVNRDEQQGRKQAGEAQSQPAANVPGSQYGREDQRNGGDRACLFGGAGQTDESTGEKIAAE